jgi:heat shock protein HtpX
MTNQLKTIALVGALAALVVGVGAALAPGHVYLFAGLALAMNIGAYFFSDKIVLRMHRAQEVTPQQAPELYGMVDELAKNAQLPMPRVFIIPDQQPNAFATGRNPAHGVVAVTEGIMRILSPRELRGVLAHELAHIKNRDILLSSIAAVLVSFITSVAHMLSFAAFFGGAQSDEEEGHSPMGGLLIALVAPLAATLVQMGISRSREYQADRVGAQISGDPEALANALLKLERGAQLIPSEQPRPATASMFIVNPLTGAGSVMQLFSTHPATQERVRRLTELARSVRSNQPGQGFARAGVAE